MEEALVKQRAAKAPLWTGDPLGIMKSSIGLSDEHVRKLESVLSE
jgi:hypothetical protein